MIGKPTTYTVLPMQVRIDYLRMTDSSVMANISVQFENRDLQFQAADGVQKSVVNLLGRVSTMTRRPVTAFERPLEIDAPPGHAAEVCANSAPFTSSQCPFSRANTG